MPTVLKSVIKPIGRRLLQWRNHLRRIFAIWWFDKPCSATGPFDDQVVFIRWDAKLGDTVVLSWVWRELARQRPDLKLSVITNSAFERLFRDDYGVESVYLAPKRHGWRALAAIARQIGRPKYVVHLAEQFKARDMFFIQRLSPGHVVGLDDELRMVDVKLGSRTAGGHFSDKLVPWLEGLGIKTENRSYWLPESAEARQSIDAWWPKTPVISVCPFGASKRRHLDVTFVVALIRRLLAGHVKIVLLVTPSFRPLMLELIQQQNWQTTVFLNPGSASMHELFEQVRRSSAVVSVDTAIVHIATALNRPLLAIYDGTDSENFVCWHPNSPIAKVLKVPGVIAEIGELIDEGEIEAQIQTLLASIRPVAQG